MLDMTYTELIQHYKSQAKATAAVGRSQQRAVEWKREGVPIDIQCRYQIITRGKLKADKTLLTLPDRNLQSLG